MWKFCLLRKSQVLNLLLIKSNFSQCLKTRTVDLPMGKVKGKWQCGLCGFDYFSFEGIPYGKPPIGELRFRPSQPADPWENKELNCLQEPEVPVQFDRDAKTIFGTEDCLKLNVYTKHFNTAKPPLPVLLYIHGGGFRYGGATRTKYAPDFLLREDIVYVVFSYRLCALGFLSLSSPELGVPGNAGLSDQLLALRWVKEHVKCFNGDPDNITVMGTSAGAASVHFMMCLPEACGLFHRAIVMSGSILSPWVQVPHSATFFCRLALAKGYKGIVTEASVLKFLRSLPAEELVEHHLFGLLERCFGHLYPFVPGLENQTSCNGKSEGLLRRPFLQMMRDAWSKDVALLIGGTADEGLVMYPYVKQENGYMLDLMQQQPDLVLPYDLYTSLSCAERAARTDELIRFHYGPREINKSNVMQSMDLFGYKLFWHGIHRVIISRLAFAKAPNYLYRFDYDSSEANLMRVQLCGNDIKRGVCHADELGYMFPRKGVRPMNEFEYGTVHRMVGILTSFARTGNPNCLETEPENWTPVDKKNPFRGMNIGRKLEVQTIAEKDGILLWNRLYNNDKALLYGL